MTSETSTTRRSTWPRVAVVFAIWLLYALSFTWMHSWAGDQTGALAFIPVVVGGILLGRRGGLLTGIVVGAANFILYGVAHPGFTLTDHTREGMLAQVILVVVGYGTGVMGEALYRSRLRNVALDQKTTDLDRALNEKEAYLQELRLFRHLLDNTTDSIFIIDPERGNFLDVNATACRSSGYGRQELLGMSVVDIEADLPDGFRWADHVRTIREARTVLLHGRHRHKDGVEVPVEMNVALLAHGGKEYLIAVVRDITERKSHLAAIEAGRQRYDHLVRSVKDTVYELIVSADGAMQCTYVSGQGKALGGHSPDELTAGRARWLDLVHPDDAESARHHILNLDADGTHAVAVYRAFDPDRPDQDPVWVENTALVTETRDGKRKVLGVCRDITDRVKGDQARIEAVERQAEIEHLKSIARFKTTFLNTAAHELNTPLTPLVLQLDLLRSQHLGPLVPRQEKAIDLIERNIERLSYLVRDMLEAARLERGGLTLVKSDTEIKRICDEALQVYLPQAQAKGVSCRITGAQSEIQADCRRMAHVISNLLSNAVKFTPPGGRVEIAVLEDEREVRVEVRDTGTGLTKDQIARLFEPFTQVHDPAEENRGGTGLGLYICKGIVEQHEGKIGCVSAGPGRGSTFWFSLPHAQSGDVEQTEREIAR